MKELATGRMDGRRHSFSFKIEQMDNGSFVASVVHEGRKHADDDVGALYYVIAVIFIYGCSILMMIASYIRKNKTDRKLNRYLKEMANVRKRERQMQLLSATAKAATITQNENKSPKLPGIKESAEKTGLTKKEPSKLTFSLDTAGPQKLYSDRVYLDLPVSTYSYNSDSDNETSTEAEPMMQCTPITSHQRSPSQKSILKKTRSKSVTLTIESDRSWTGSNVQLSPPKSPSRVTVIEVDETERPRRGSVCFEEDIKDVNEKTEAVNTSECDNSEPHDSSPHKTDDFQLVVSTV